MPTPTRSSLSSGFLAIVSLCVAGPISGCGGDEETRRSESESESEPLLPAPDSQDPSVGADAEASNRGDDDENDDNSGEEAGAVGATDPAPSDGLEPVTDATPEALVVFVTSTRHTAALGGSEGADELCNATASAAALEGTFRAWLSTRDTAVSERLRQFDGPYVRTDGVQIADGWGDLVDGNLRAAISVDERGNAASGDVWTGTLGDGTPLRSDDCGGFTIGDSSGRAQCGSSNTTSSAWTQNLTPSCSLALRVYCFEQ